MVDPVVGREESLALLREHLPVLTERFGVRGLTLFGSTARDEATDDSDVDILVQELDCPSSWGRYEVEDYLEALFGRRIDLVLRHRMRREYMAWVEADEVDPMNPRPLMPRTPLPKRWDVHVQEMIYRCERVRAVSTELTYEQYLIDEDRQEAISFSLEHIGEAARKIPQQVQEEHDEIAWHQIIGLRHRLAHAYYQIDHVKLWQFARHDVPELLKHLPPLLAQARDEAEASDPTD